MHPDEMDLEKKRRELLKSLEERIGRGEFSTHSLRVGPPVGEGAPSEEAENDKEKKEESGKN